MSKQHTNPEILSLKEVLLTTKAYFFELLKKSYWYVIFGAIFFFVARYYAHKKPIIYKAESSFMTNNDKSSGMSGILQLAGNFGFGGGKSGELSGEKIVSLLSSRRMIYETLLKTVEIENKEDLLFNHYLQLFELEKCFDLDSISDFRFKNENVNQFSYNEQKAAKCIFSDIYTQHLNANAEQSGIITVSYTGTSEQFSKEFIETLVKNLEGYYSKKSVEQQQKTYNIIKNRVDSLANSLYQKEEQLATWIDNNRVPLRVGSLTAKKMMEQERLKSRAEILSVMYAEAIKSREIAYMNLLSNTPVIQIIDLPIYPIKGKEFNRLTYYIYAILAAFFLVTLFVVFNKIVRDAFKDDKV
ncbi:MAG: hypothetical protein ACPG5B_13510 [Chitinophagales bacterium]